MFFVTGSLQSVFNGTNKYLIHMLYSFGQYHKSHSYPMIRVCVKIEMAETDLMYWNTIIWSYSLELQ